MDSGKNLLLWNDSNSSPDKGRVANTQRTVPMDSGLLTMARDIGICLGEV